MPRSHPLPKIWLMTDARFGDDQLRAIQQLPARSGVVFRHYDLATQQRRALFAQVLRICRRRGHIVLLAGMRGPLYAGMPTAFINAAMAKRSCYTAPQSTMHAKSQT